MTMDELLWLMSRIGASDLHIKVGSPPAIRKDGKLHHIEGTSRLKPDEARALAYSIMSEEQQKTFEREHDIDFGHSVSGLARFRVNVFQQRGSVSLVLRQIPSTIPDIDQLGLPAVCKRLALKPRGLVLVTGAAGCGKSTTLAAMIDHTNSKKQAHILTLEAPIEFLHRDRESLVNQREVGADTKSFAEGLRRSMREDPDVILVGEMLDLETMALAMMAAETGHLVLGTMHATSAVNTVEGIIDVFPSEQQPQIRLQLSVTLEGVISQILVPKIGGGRAAAFEVLVGTPAVRGAVREGKIGKLQDFLKAEREGMQALESNLARLVKNKIVTLEDALARANSPRNLEMLLGKQNVVAQSPAFADSQWG
jgi:twitching motility protein PilT